MKKGMPKFIERIFELYPSFHLLEGLAATFLLIHDFQNGIFIWIFVAYFQSPLLWRFLNFIFGPCPKVSYIGRKVDSGSLWQISYQLQALYTSFNFLERILKLLPGFYSAWLRLWGAKIGQKVLWTPGCQIVDRPFVHIGDRVLMGQNSYFSTHVIKKKDNRYLLYVKNIEIGSDTVISYRSTLSAGVTVGKRSFVAAGAEIYPNTVLKPGAMYDRQ